jgi:formylglycine-generating enzyme required for sulfatase activity
MKTVFLAIIAITIACFSGQLNINFNDGTPSVVVDFNDLHNIEIIEDTTPAGFVIIPGGTFTMGDHFNEGDSAELPLHSVTLSDFFMGTTEVTQAEWKATMGSWNSNPWGWGTSGVGDTYPVYYVTWYSMIKYCNLRSINEGLAPCYKINNSTDPATWGTAPYWDFNNDYVVGNTALWDAVTCDFNAKGYRLPTEAEWEYAARGGLSGQRYSNGATISHSTNGNTQANYYSYWLNGSPYYSYDVSPTGGYHPLSNGGRTMPVGSFPANGYGLYDISGNVWEWCWDWYGSYTSDAQTDPTGPTTGSGRVGRGSFWEDFACYCRVANRLLYGPYGSNPYGSSYNCGAIGFRLARTP